MRSGGGGGGWEGVVVMGGRVGDSILSTVIAMCAAGYDMLSKNQR